jgi:hypothetical protein
MRVRCFIMSDKNQSRADLLWDCFVNWAETLEKIQRGRKANTKSRGF